MSVIDGNLSVWRKLFKGTDVATPGGLLVVMMDMLVTMASSIYPVRGALQTLGWYMVAIMVVKTIISSTKLLCTMSVVGIRSCSCSS